MKKSILFLLLVFVIETEVFSQSCLPDGITFSTQTEIDNFQINYPNCTEIGGVVLISEGDDITSLDGLNMITSIGNSLVIEECNALLNLSGLQNLTNIDGGLEIIGNNLLNSLEGLNMITSIGNSLVIEECNALYNLSGLQNLTNIDGGFQIIGNNLLKSLEGLNNLMSIGGYFGIYANDSLFDLTSLNNLTSVGGNITIVNNKTLQSLSGLENINEGTITNLDIYNNKSLSICNVQSICDYLVSPNGTINIYDNSTGCNTPSEIAYECGITLNCLPFGNYYLRSQVEVDSFFTNYPNCTHLNGSLNIEGENIKNLFGLYGLKSIATEFVVERNDSLLNFEGLNTLSCIHGDFWVGNDYPYYGNSKLRDFSGLDSLTSIGGYFSVKFNDSLIDFSGLGNLTTIGQFNIEGNYSLTSLTGLNHLDSIYNGFTLRNTNLNDLSEIINLRYVGEYITISNNDYLNSLTGLDNINTTDISYLSIEWNNLLSTCEVQSICEFIADPMNYPIITSNYNGCNSKEEINEACNVVSSSNTESKPNYIIYPNPAKKELHILNNSIVITEINIYNQLGQRLLNERMDCQHIDISLLESGIYIIELLSKETKTRQKLIIK